MSAGYYERHVFVCGNQRAAGHARGCCASKGAEALRNYFKARVKELGLAPAKADGSAPRGGVRVNAAGCLDQCESGPCLVIYPEGVWYRATSEAEIDEIITSHLQAGQVVARLMID